MATAARHESYLAPVEMNAVYGKVFARSRSRSVGSFLVRRGGARDRRAVAAASTTRLAYGLGLLAFDVSLGFNGLPTALYDYFLPARALRIPARMGMMVGFRWRCWRATARCGSPNDRSEQARRIVLVAPRG